MNQDFDENRAVEARLRDERPTLTAHQLDEAKQRALGAGRARRGGLMRSRAAFTAILATGILMSGTGATMAVTGIAGDGSASVSQYTPPGDTTPTTTPTNPPAQPQTPSSTPPTIGPTQTTPTNGGGGGNEGASDNGGGGNDGTSDDDNSTNDDGDVQDEQQTSDDGSSGGDDSNAASQVRSTSQAAAADGSKQLPFTGIAVFPLLFGGLALVAVGAVMRRRLPDPTA